MKHCGFIVLWLQLEKCITLKCVKLYEGFFFFLLGFVSYGHKQRRLNLVCGWDPCVCECVFAGELDARLLIIYIKRPLPSLPVTPPLVKLILFLLECFRDLRLQSHDGRALPQERFSEGVSFASSSQDDGAGLLQGLCRFPGLGVVVGHVNAADLDAVGDAGAVAPPPQLLQLGLEVVTEDVVDERVVDGGALGEHARQEADFWRDGAVLLEDGPQAHHAVRRPAAYEAHGDQHGDLQQGAELEQFVCVVWYQSHGSLIPYNVITFLKGKYMFLTL